MARRNTTPTMNAAPARPTRKTGQNSRKTLKPSYDESRIRARAYQIYLKRNNGAGSALGDWLQAERELRESLKT